MPLPAARAALGALVGVCALVGVVSGRPVQFLRDALALDGVTYVGQYGLERLVDGAVVTDPRVEPFRAAVARAARPRPTRPSRTLRGAERDVAVTLHWRTASERGDAAAAWVAERRRGRGSSVYPTRMAVELRPPVPMDKGTAVAALFARVGRRSRSRGVRRRRPRRSHRVRRPRALRGSGRLEHAVCVGVRSTEAPPELMAAADVIVDGPPGSRRCWPSSAPRSGARVPDLGLEPAPPAGSPARVTGGVGALGARSPGSIVSAACSASAVCTTSNGCTGRHALSSTSNAPASRERQSTPSRRLTSGPSIATRLSPSWTGFTSSTSLRAKPASERAKSSRVSSDHRLPVGGAPALVDARGCLLDLVAVRLVLGECLARRVEQRGEHHAASELGVLLEQQVVGEEPAHDVLRELHAVAAHDQRSVADALLELRQRRGDLGQLHLASERGGIGTERRGERAGAAS